MSSILFQTDKAAAQYHLVSRRNGVGLDRDVDLISELLSTTGEVCRRDVHDTARLAFPFQRTARHKHMDDVFCFVERIPWLWDRAPGRKVVIPNQERFPRRHVKRLRRMDSVLCKSRHAMDACGRFTDRVTYVGFTSQDRNSRDIQPEYDRFFHLAGRSTMKGTETLLDVWSAHADWPTLTLVQNPKLGERSVPKNVNLITEYLDDDKLRTLQNQHGIHLCPSKCEGWGHYIAEAMSCGAVVITTDAPPMNELIAADRGLLASWSTASPRHLGSSFSVDPVALERSIQILLNCSQSTKADLGAAARSWFVKNDRQFRQRFAGVVTDSSTGTWQGHAA